MATDYEQRLKKTDLFISDFVPTEYTEYTPHQSAFLKQIQKRALVEYEHDETNTIIVNDDLKPLTTSSTSTTTTTAPTSTATTIPCNTGWINDAECDDINNNMECSYDGGDCCGCNVNTQFCEVCGCLDPNGTTCPS